MLSSVCTRTMCISTYLPEKLVLLVFYFVTEGEGTPGIATPGVGMAGDSETRIVRIG